jgi:hypothetical protein
MPGGKRRNESWLSCLDVAIKVAGMNARRFIAAAVVLAAACSPTPPGVQPNTTYFWLVTSSGVMFNDYCSDNMMFRNMNMALMFADNSYIIYKGSADGRKATLMKCTALDPNACMPADGNIVFDVTGAEMSYETESSQPIGGGPCNQQDDQSWILTDHVQTLDMQINDTLSLTGDMTTCNRIETDAENNSMNHKGYQGCTITFTIGGSAQ